MVTWLRLTVCPAQTGPFEVGEGAAGVAFTTTFTVPAVLVQPLAVAVTLYVPDIAVVAEGMVGF